MHLSLAEMKLALETTFCGGARRYDTACDRLMNACFRGGFSNVETPDTDTKDGRRSRKRNRKYIGDEPEEANIKKNKNGYPGEKVQVNGCSLAFGEEPPPAVSDMYFTNRVDISSWNCLSGNTYYLLDVMGHSSYLKTTTKPNIYFRKYGDMSTMKDDLRRMGYSVINLPKRMNFDTLSRFVNMIRVPLLLDLDLLDTQFLHVIAAIPIFVKKNRILIGKIQLS